MSKRALPAASSRPALRRHLPHALLSLAILAYALGFGYLTIERYAAFEARALDMGNLNQAVWNTAFGEWFHLTNQPGTVNRLSLHVEPILIPIAWLYRLYPAPPTLLAIQAVVVALGALPLFALARHKLANAWAGLAFGLIFLLNPAIQAANWLEFHPLTLAPTFLLAALYFLVAGREPRHVALFALFALLAASCKEEIGLLVFMLGLYALIIQRRARLGLITMTLSLGWSLLAVLVIQNRFAAGNIHWGRYAYLGETPGQMVLSLLTRPDLVWAQLQAAETGRYLVELLWPTGFLALLAPEILLLALPSLAINLLADFPPMHQVNSLIYAAPIVPFALAASVWGAARLRGWVARWGPRWATGALIAAVTLALGCTVADQVRAGYLPGGGNYLPLTVTAHHRRAATILAQIDPDAAVSAQDRLNPHVSGRETVYIFPRVEDPRQDADTVWIDVTGPAWPQHPNDVRATVDDLLATGFGIAAADDGYLLLRRGETNKTPGPEFYSAWQRPALAAGSTLDASQRVDFGPDLSLLDVQVTTDRYGELITRLTWQANRPLAQDLRFYIAYFAPDGTLLHDSEFYQPVSVLWYPTSAWEPHVPVQITTLPWTLDVDRFVLGVGVYGGDSWAEGERLLVSQMAAPRPLLENGALLRVGGFVRTDPGLFSRAAWEPVKLAPDTAQTALDVRFGDVLRLEGVTLPDQVEAGSDLRFTLTWRAEAPIPFDYAVFAHLLDEQGERVAQLDWQPTDRAGVLPMTAWVVGAPVVDSQRLPLPATLSPGVYRLAVGVYNWQDNTRLPAHGTAVRPGDVVEFGPIRVE